MYKRKISTIKSWHPRCRKAGYREHCPLHPFSETGVTIKDPLGRAHSQETPLFVVLSNVFPVPTSNRRVKRLLGTNYVTCIGTSLWLFTLPMADPRQGFSLTWRNSKATLDLQHHLTVQTQTCFPFVGLPWWLRWYTIRLQCWGPGFHPWVRKIFWRRE